MAQVGSHMGCSQIQRHGVGRPRNITVCCVVCAVLALDDAAGVAAAEFVDKRAVSAMSFTGTLER